MKSPKTITLLTAVVAMQFVVTTPTAWAQQPAGDNTHAAIVAAHTKPVAWDTFVRAESDKYFKSYADIGAFGKFYNIRQPTPINAQKVVRMNRDTLYSMGIFDLTTPVTITMPDTGDRFQSMQVISEDEYTLMVNYKSGKYTLTQKNVGTRYVLVLFRTLVDSSDPADIKKVNAIQDQIKAEQASVGEFEVPNWDQKSQDRLRDAINVLASTMTSFHGSFGTKEEVNPVAYLLGAASGWGGNPDKDAMYLNVTPENNDGKTAYTVTAKDVPVDGFWSVSLYNGKGFFQMNPYNAYSINNITGEKAKDGSITIHFGGDPKQSNYLPIMDGWNYIVRLYQPHKEILDGTWKFPAPQAVQ